MLILCLMNATRLDEEWMWLFWLCHEPESNLTDFDAGVRLDWMTFIDSVSWPNASAKEPNGEWVIVFPIVDTS